MRYPQFNLKLGGKQERASSQDRFIPKLNQELFEISRSERKTTNRVFDSDNINQSLRSSQQSLNYNNLLENNIISPSKFNNKMSKKIINYQNVLNCQPYNLYEQIGLVTNENSQKIIRNIQKNPFKILDAPKLKDDFYLNLLDWGLTNIICIGLENTFYTWNADSSITAKIHILNDNIQATSVKFSQKGNLIALGDDHGYLKVIDVQKQTTIRSYNNHDSRISSIIWNDYLVGSGSQDRTICNSDIRAPQKFTFKLLGHKQEICGLDWSPDGQILASGGNDNKVFLWSLKKQQQMVTFNQHKSAIKAIAWNPHQQNILATGGGTSDQTIKFWNTNTFRLQSSVNTNSQVCNMKFSNNVNEIVSTHGFSKNLISIWDYSSMQKIASLQGHSQRVLYLAISPCGQNIVTGAGDETLRFWNVFPRKNILNENQNILEDSLQTNFLR